jgi:hypothetical protein
MFHRNSTAVARSLRQTLGVVSVALSSVLFGCGGAVTQFEPAHASGRAGAMYPVTSYELKVGSSSLGDAVVWSEGATDPTSDEEQVLDLEIAVHNATNAPLKIDIDKSAVSVSLRDGRRELLGSPRSVGGSRTVPPDALGRMGCHYALPRGLRSSDVAAFDFNWRVASLVGDYAQSTAFVPRPPQGAEAFDDRGLPCGGVYRISSPHECVGEPPLLASEPPFQHP